MTPSWHSHIRKARWEAQPPGNCSIRVHREDKTTSHDCAAEPSGNIDPGVVSPELQHTARCAQGWVGSYGKSPSHGYTRHITRDNCILIGPQHVRETGMLSPPQKGGKTKLKPHPPHWADRLEGHLLKLCESFALREWDRPCMNHWTSYYKYNMMHNNNSFPPVGSPPSLRAEEYDCKPLVLASARTHSCSLRGFNTLQKTSRLGETGKVGLT